MKTDLGFGNLLYPKVDPEKTVDSASSHLFEGDFLLRSILDVAERGHLSAGDAAHHEECDRFYMIIQLLNLYRSGIGALGGRLAKIGSGKAA
jgi:hypothetical protein